MSEKPILFNTEMVRAILEGRKTVTRRLIRMPKNIEIDEDGCVIYYGDGYGDGGKFANIGAFEEYFRLSPYQPDDLLYVRETWCSIPDLFGEFEQYSYKADGEIEGAKWRPSIHMPKEAARIWLRVTDVHVERLQDITEDGARAEGSYYGAIFDGGNPDGIKAKHSFISLWDSTIKMQNIDAYGWSANPYVWVIEFERVEEQRCK